MASQTLEVRNFINGKYVETTSTERITVVNPYDGSVVASDVQVAGSAEIDAAVEAAEAAYRGAWGKVTGAERAALLVKLADLIERDADELARLEVLGSGLAFQLIRERLTPMAVGSMKRKKFLHTRQPKC